MHPCRDVMMRNLIHLCRRLSAALLLGAACMPLCARSSEEATIDDFRRMGLPFYTGNEIRVLPTCDEKYRELFSTIRSARRYVHLDYFKFQQDSIGAALFSLLGEKAAEGVEVRVIYDAVGNSSSDMPLRRKFLKRARAAGIKVHAFDRARFPWINHLFHRDHHKIAVIDGEHLFTGGMNVADYYIYGKPKIGQWRDMHMKAEGSMVDKYESIFAYMWDKVTGEKLDSVAYAGSGCSNDSILVAVCDRLPRVSPEIIRRTYCIAIDNAQSMIQIVNPYPSLFGDVRDALYRALDRGVRVQFMVSTNNDNVANADVVALEMNKLMKRGGEVYYYNGAFHHSKIMMIDSLFCTIGTANLDARSLRFDYEVNSYIFDKGVTAELQTIFARDMEACTLLTPEEWEKRYPLRRRIRAGLFMPVKKLL